MQPEDNSSLSELLRAAIHTIIHQSIRKRCMDLKGEPTEGALVTAAMKTESIKSKSEAVSQNRQIPNQK